LKRRVLVEGGGRKLLGKFRFDLLRLNNGGELEKGTKRRRKKRGIS